MGYDSHGVMRAAQYVREVLEGRLKPGAPVHVVQETSTTAIVDCGLNFGAVGAQKMVDVVCVKAEAHRIASVVSQNCHHVGRLGSWVHKIASRGLIGLAFVNNVKRGHQVAPWGGREGRLGTNPLAWAVPRRDGPPVMLDMATCMIPEGKIRVALHAGKPVPAGCIVDAKGAPITDPSAYYGPPRGAILPFGGQYGHKGFGLALLVEVLGGLLVGLPVSEDHPYVNGLCLIAIDPDAFCGRARFTELVEDLAGYVKSATPADGCSEVLMPGEPDHRMREKRLRDGIPLEEETWRQIVEVRQRMRATDEGNGLNG